MAEVLIVGELLAEIMADKVGQRFDTPGVFLGPYPSGAPGIFIDQVGKLGVSCSIIACVGKDGFGDQIVKRLKQDGVDTSKIMRADGLPTGCAFVTYRQDGSREFIFNIGNSAAALIDEGMVDEAWTNGCKYLHVMGSFLVSPESRALISKSIRLAKQAGGKISFDPNVRTELLSLPGTKDALFDVLRACSVFMPSEADLEVLFGKLSEKECVTKLQSDYPNLAMIIVKKARQGATFYDREGSISAPAFKVTEVDPTGAGDSFGGTFVASLVQKMPIEKALTLACAAGALAVSKKGPMEGNATMVELETFIASAERV